MVLRGDCIGNGLGSARRSPGADCDPLCTVLRCAARDGLCGQRERRQASDEQPPNLRARALFYVGSTLVVAVLGYRFIAGFPLPTSLVLVALGVGVALMLLAFKVGAAGVGQAGDGHPRDAGPAGHGR